MTSIDPRPALAALLGALLAASTPALADEVRDASKLLRAGQHQQALERVNKALSAKPKDAQARFLKGLIYAEQGNAKDATDIFLQLTKDYPDLPEPYNNLAVIYASQGQYDKALQIDSANPGAKNKLALVRELVGGVAPVVVATATARPPVAVAAAPAQKEPAVVAAADPKPAPEKPVAVKSANAEVLGAVNTWAKAWSSKNVDAYLGFYAKDFKTPGGESRADWEKARRQRIGAPKSIAVTVDSPKVSIAEGKASVTFRQGYRSDVIKSTTATKTLVLAQSDGRWRILYEGGA